MPLYDSADLLDRCKRLARRPPTDQAMPNEHWYAFMTEAQSEVYPEISSRYPDTMYGAPILMTTSDNGATYSFGLDADGDPIRATGHAEIYPNLKAIPSSPLTPGEDFMIEGGLVRIPHGGTRRFTGGPYARLVLSPDTPITATADPELLPKHARMLLVFKALQKWASRPGSGAKPEYYEGEYNKYLNKIFLELSTQYNRMGHTFQGSTGLLYVGDFGQVGLNT